MTFLISIPIGPRLCLFDSWLSPFDQSLTNLDTAITNKDLRHFFLEAVEATAYPQISQIMQCARLPVKGCPSVHLAFIMNLVQIGISPTSFIVDGTDGYDHKWNDLLAKNKSISSLVEFVVFQNCKAVLALSMLADFFPSVKRLHFFNSPVIWRPRNETDPNNDDEFFECLMPERMWKQIDSVVLNMSGTDESSLWYQNINSHVSSHHNISL